MTDQPNPLTQALDAAIDAICAAEAHLIEARRSLIAADYAGRSKSLIKRGVEAHLAGDDDAARGHFHEFITSGSKGRSEAPEKAPESPVEGEVDKPVYGAAKVLRRLAGRWGDE